MKAIQEHNKVLILIKPQTSFLNHSDQFITTSILQLSESKTKKKSFMLYSSSNKLAINKSPLIIHYQLSVKRKMTLIKIFESR